MERKKKPLIASITVGIILILVVPVLINYLLRMPTPFDIPVVCDPSSWLSFWGAYFGGVLTAMIGFVTLYFNQKTYRDAVCKLEADKRKELQRLQTRELERELIRRVESLSVGPLTRLIARLPNELSSPEAQSEIQVLKRRMERVESQGISWGLMYWPDTMKSKPDGFEAVYLIHMEQFRVIVNNVIALLNEVASQKERSLELGRIKKLEEDVKQYNASFVMAFAKPIQNWIKEEMQIS